MANAQPSAGGAWGLTVIMVVIVSWVIYKYLVPRGGREWRNAGLIQAFIIALYAEMYGFPLTIYVLTSFLGIDVPWLHMSGHLWSYLFGWGRGMAMVEMLFGYAFVFAGLSLIVQGWKKIYSVRDKETLVREGLYRYMRHPQYTGIFLAIFGQLIHWPTIATLVLFPVIVWVYYRLARKEEKVMIKTFGEEYLAYKKKVPMFFPRRRDWSKVFAKDS